MNKIKVMDENLANKISAGEVVESCASVVKELVENAIDAKSNEIIVSLVEGGLKEIKVMDNGIGMDHDDALLAFSRHATSKVLKEDDLFFIDTLGFRGEALPSIASVSMVTLKTCTDKVGTQIEINGGKIISDTKCEARKGTVIRVKDLFYNTPARLKYLKGPKEELNFVTSFLEKLSLSHPNIKFSLLNNDKTIVSTSGSGELLKCIHEIYGMNVSSNMLEVKGSNDDYDISGYVCKPSILKSNRNHLITFVNGRIIRNNEINRAINDAYYTYKPDTKFPIVVLNIYTDPTLVDVNIHPTKQDIKISKSFELTELIIKTIKDVLAKKDMVIPIRIEKKESDDSALFTEGTMASDTFIKEEQASFEFIESIIDSKDSVKRMPILYPVGLLLGTYIACQNEQGIYLIDQHAAEERINYEKYLKALKEKEISRTEMLIPIAIELSKSEFMLIEECFDILNSLGFKVEEFGINTLKFSEHPTWLKEGYEEESIRKILDLLVIEKNNFDVVKFNEHIAITLACKLSIKANYEISMAEMEHIISELGKCENPFNCPHGRPTIISFSCYELERMFKRVM